MGALLVSLLIGLPIYPPESIEGTNRYPSLSPLIVLEVDDKMSPEVGYACVYTRGGLHIIINSKLSDVDKQILANEAVKACYIPTDKYPQPEYST